MGILIEFRAENKVGEREVDENFFYAIKLKARH